MKIPNIYDVIVLLIGLNGSNFEGKTNIHKNLFILQKMFDKNIAFPFKFKPYFYGPYSEQISKSLDLLENIGILKSSEKIVGGEGPFDIRQTTYELTRIGNDIFENLENEYSEFYNKFNDCFLKLKSTRFHQHTRILATAAKIKHILSLEKKSLTYGNIKLKAKELGWEIDDCDVDSAVELLKHTGLAK